MNALSEGPKWRPEVKAQSEGPKWIPKVKAQSEEFFWSFPESCSYSSRIGRWSLVWVHVCLTTNSPNTVHTFCSGQVGRIKVRIFVAWRVRYVLNNWVLDVRMRKSLLQSQLTNCFSDYLTGAIGLPCWVISCNKMLSILFWQREQDLESRDFW